MRNDEIDPNTTETDVGFPFGIACDDPLVPAGDEWWQPMRDQEFEEWLSPDQSES